MDGRQSRSGTQKRPTAPSNCHARLWTKELAASGVLAAAWQDGMQPHHQGGEKGCFHESSPSTSSLFFFSLLIWSYLIWKTNELFQKHKVNIWGWKQVIGWFVPVQLCPVFPAEGHSPPSLRPFLKKNTADWQDVLDASLAPSASDSELFTLRKEVYLAVPSNAVHRPGRTACWRVSHHDELLSVVNECKRGFHRRHQRQ